MAARRTEYRRDTKDESTDADTAAATEREEMAERERGGEGPESRALADGLCEARRDYDLATHEAQIEASHAWWRAYGEFGAAQHRIALDGGLRRRSAYQTWFRSSQDAWLRGDENLSANAHETYQRAIEEAAKAEQLEWEEAYNAYCAALSAGNEAYAVTARSALKVYLSRLQAVWGGADIASIGPAGLARLAQESGHVAQIAQSLHG